MSDKNLYSSNSEDAIAENKNQLKKPRMHKVILFNDDFTSMEFVITVLVEVFRKSMSEATQLTLQIHHKGVGVCGVYSYEIAETKVALVLQLAEKNEFPLQATLEEV